jgi:hypothetical protein
MSDGTIISHILAANRSPHSVVTEDTSATILKGLFVLVDLLLHEGWDWPMTILTIRKHQRFAVRREAGLQMQGRAPRIGLLVELSLEGCRMSIVEAAKYTVGQALKIEIAGYGAIKTRIRWADTGVLGMRFDQPLHVADLNVLLAACRTEFANDGMARAYGT